jgi:2-haloacid dehalogenase
MAVIRPRAVVFDIGNVLVTWAPERLYDQLLPRAEREALFERAGLHAMNDRVDRGAPWKETVYAKAEEFPEYRDVIRAWHDRWIEMASPLIPHSWHLLRQLKAAGVPVFALTNFGRESFDYALGVYPELAEFDRSYVSGRMGVIKPEAAIYEMVEADCGLKGSELFFTDDRAENIEAAVARGWQAHRFTEPAGLAAELVRLGLLGPEAARES